RAMLKDDGAVFFLEWSPETFRPPSEYQAFRTLDIWLKTLHIVGLEPTLIQPYFNPHDGSVAAWLVYIRKPVVRIMGKLARFKLPQTWSRRVLKNEAERALRDQPYKAPQRSSLNVLVAQPLLQK